jgi:hypothetical protein
MIYRHDFGAKPGTLAGLRDFTGGKNEALTLGDTVAVLANSSPLKAKRNY